MSWMNEGILLLQSEWICLCR